ncbi:UDP-N-acetylglucosamine 2-epimerase (non-hydrolyzing) [Candidatus Pelagibacter ubique]|nr:UDP-N-acetylglucosamine 2-epimerase (non-hydrolyzing) [Candidatus Pelagibacter ubique]
MKIVTLLGTRPEFIRLSRIIPLLDRYSKHTIIHTGQNYDYNLNKIFFKNLKIRKPDLFLNAKGSFGEQLSKIFCKLEKNLLNIKPDRFLVLGDTNSSLGAVIAKRLSIPVFHMEAGNRQYNDEVPEEINRRIIDHSSDILLPYTNRSCENLVKEGINRKKIFITGNPIFEVMNFYEKKINNSKILDALNLTKDNYLLLTAHRQENVDSFKRLNDLISILKKISLIKKKQIIWPIHPRTKIKLKKFKIKLHKNIKLIEPLDFFDFSKLEKNCLCIISDSGTVQEEAAILKKPNLIIRDATERPETIEAGSSILIGSSIKNIKKQIKIALELNGFEENIPEYIVPNVSQKIIKILFSKYEFD